MILKDLVIKNQANTDVTFVAVRPQGGETSPALWIVKSGNRNSQERFEALVRRANGNQSYKTVLKSTLPVMDAVDPNVKLTNVIWELTLTSPDVITDSVALDVAVKLKNLLSNASIQQMLANQEPAI